jgi:hypothetical protein
MESQLERQRLRPLPPEWRGPILEAARQATESAAAPAAAPRVPQWVGLVSAFWRQGGLVFWPSPGAWAGLAAVWVGLLGLHLAIREPSAPETAAVAPPSPLFLAARAQQQRLLAEFLRRHAEVAPMNARPPVPPRPQSQAGLIRLGCIPSTGFES